MEPNYYPGKPAKEQPEPMKWAGKKPTEDELKQILADHDAWLEDQWLREEKKAASPPPHDLSEADLSKSNLHGAELSGAELSGADLGGADLGGANLRRADLGGADLRGANLSMAELSGADLSGACLIGADLSDANVTSVEYNRKTEFLGSKTATAWGSPRFLAFARHQEFLEELRGTGRGNALYWVWNIFADCGRTPWYWILWSLFFCLGFAGLYWYMQVNGAPAFRLGDGLANEFFTMLYFSVVTFTTLGFGDVTPLTFWARVAVMAEVVIGYAMLGGLISIFATLITRRS